MKTLTAAGLQCRHTTLPAANAIYYILAPVDIPEGDIETWSATYDANLAIVGIRDWDNDLSPWPAPGQPPGSPAFQGHGPAFLQTLTDAVIPAIESAIGLTTPPRRTAVGISMSGLFATWAWASSTLFTDLISLSGSFWYEGFTTWLDRQPLPPGRGRAYLSLGTAEPRSRTPLFATVGTATQHVVDTLCRRDIDTTFEWVPGGHHVSYIPRIAQALSTLHRRP